MPRCCNCERGLLPQRLLRVCDGSATILVIQSKSAQRDAEYMSTFVTLVGYLVWPALIFYVVWKFESEIRAALTSVPNLANRLNKAGIIEFQPLAIQQVQELEVHQIETLAWSRDALVVPYEDHLLRHLRSTGIDRQPDYTERLIYSMAEFARVAQGEIVARTIFGTQIAALKQMNSAPLTPEALKVFHDRHIHKVTDDDRGQEPLTFDQWLYFFTVRELAEVSDDGRYAATPTAASLLRYLEAREVSEASSVF